MAGLARAPNRLDAVGLVTPDYQAQAREWVELTCKEQGLQSRISDVGTVRKIATIFVAALDSPDGSEPVEIDRLARPLGAVDDNVVEHSGDHSPALVKIHGTPPAPERSALADEAAD